MPLPLIYSYNTFSFHFRILRKWLAEAKSLCSIKDAEKFHLDRLEDEINMLEKQLSQDYQDIGFCHNDLQYGNIMMDEETRSITIIVSFLCCFVNLCITWLLHYVPGFGGYFFPFDFLDTSLFGCKRYRAD